MHWLARRPGIDIDKACLLRMRKEIDYGETERFAQGVASLRKTLPFLIEGGDFALQMKRFLPSDRYERTIARPEFRVVLAKSIRELYDRCAALL